MKPFTQLVHFDPAPKDPFHPMSSPIYQTATFDQESLEVESAYNYSRSGNPTRTVLEKQLAQLERGNAAFAMSSGMAAINVVIGLLKQGDHLIACDDIYGGTHRLLKQRVVLRGISVTFVDSTDLLAVKQVLQANTRMILIETPTNPLQKISDIVKLAALAKQSDVLLVVDNTFLSPWLQQPLNLGADIVIHSATKHLSGHSDLTAGVIVVNHAELANRIAFIQNAEGGALAPFECWLLLRGLKTLGLRVLHQQQSAIKIAKFLKTHAAVKHVYYAGLSDHPGYAIHHAQATGAGTVISFETGDLALSKQLIERNQLFSLSVSFGSLNSLISLPCNMSHASIPDKDRRLAPDLIRLSIGIEDSEDLINDLEQGLSLN